MKQGRKPGFFESITQVPTSTRTGVVELPILYRDGSMLAAAFLINPAVAAKKLEGLPIEPLNVLGKTPVLFCLFEYRDTTIGPYREIGVGIFTRRKHSRPSTIKMLTDIRGAENIGMYITNLPVDTEAACSAGIEIWGFPKYIAGITSSFAADSARFELEGELVVTHRSGVGLQMKGLPFITYSLLDDSLIRTIVEVGHRARFGGASSFKIEIIGDGPTAAAINSLGLNNTKPTAVFRTDDLKAILPMGKLLLELS